MLRTQATRVGNTASRVILEHICTALCWNTTVLCRVKPQQWCMCNLGGTQPCCVALNITALCCAGNISHLFTYGTPESQVAIYKKFVRHASLIASTTTPLPTPPPYPPPNSPRVPMQNNPRRLPIYETRSKQSQLKAIALVL